MNERILVTAALSVNDQTYLKTRLTDAEILFRKPSVVSQEDLEWTDIIFGGVAPERLVWQRNVVWLHSPNVGLDMYASLHLERPDLVISNATGIMDQAVAEHAVALMMALSRNLTLIMRHQSQRQWRRQDYLDSVGPPSGPTTLAGKNVHVLGYGPIARCLISLLAGLSMKVGAYRRSVSGQTSDPHVTRFLTFDSLSENVSEADVVISLLPEKAETRNLISRTVLENMHARSFLLNLGRGSAVDEVALCEVLKRGGIAGAALDVFAEEPLPESSPLWQLPNVIISPHIAGRFDDEYRRHIDAFLQRLAQYRARAEGV